MRRVSLRSFAVLLLAVAVAQCGGDGSPTPTATGLQLVTAPATSIPDRGALTPAPVVQLVDGNGEPVARSGRTITLTTNAVALTATGATDPITATTDADGRATFTGVHLRGTAGSYQLLFSGSGLQGANAPVALTPGAPAFVQWSGGPDSALVGATVSGLTVALTDSSSNKIPNAALTLAVVAGHGTVGDSVTADAGGVANVATFTLDTVVGTNTLKATPVSAPGVVAAQRTIVGKARPPVKLTKISGDSQTAPVGMSPPQAIVIQAVDMYGNGVGGVTVHGTVSLGNGSLAGGSLFDRVTAVDGKLADGEWTLGTTTGPNAITLSIPSVPSISAVVFHATGTTGIARSVTFLPSDWPASPSVDTLFTSPLTVLVADEYNNPVIGRHVIFESNDSIINSADADTLTDSLGHAAIHQVRSPLLLGTWTLFVAVPGTYASGSTRFDLQAGPPVRIELVGDSTPRLPVTKTASLQARLYDAFGNLAGDKAMVWSVASGPGTLGPIVGTTGPSGVSSATFNPAGTGHSVVTAYATLLPDSVATYAIDAVAPVAIQLMAGDSQHVVAGDTLGAIVLRVVDSAGAGVADVPVHIDDGPAGEVLFTDSTGALTVPPLVARAQVTPYQLLAKSSWITGVSATVTVLPHAGPPTELVPECCSTPTGEVGKVMPTAPGVKLLDRSHLPILSGTIHFHVSSGSLAVDSAKIDSITGIARPTGLRLGTIAGADTLQATFSGVPALNIVVLQTPGAPDTLIALPGHSIEGFVGEQVAYGIEIQARDSFGNLTPGAFFGTTGVAGGAIGLGGGQFDDSARAYVDGWKLGSIGTGNIVRISAGTAQLDFPAEGIAASPFNIVLRGVPTAFAPVFRQAAFNWRRRITADIPDISVTIPAGQCADFQQAVNGPIDDLVIDVSIGPIDGPGGILGGATPCFIRTTGKLPLLGVMQFDEADLDVLAQTGTLDDVILHEMGHVLGIGSLWSTHTLVDNTGGADPRYHGTGGETGWNLIGGVGPGDDARVPVENTGGAGTRDVHWREASMPSELMTGYLSAAVNPMSAVTIYGLADLGYSVDPSTADAYTAFTAPPFVSDHRRVEMKDRVDGPRFTVDRDGKVTRLR